MDSYKQGILTIYNANCMDIMAGYADNYFDLAVVDPPYGLGDRLVKGGKKGSMSSLRNLSDDKQEIWDIAPEEGYFNEIKRISINQIIWGGNYFFDYLQSNDGVLIWDKMNGTNPLADAEIAWKSMKGTSRIFRMHHFSSGYGKKIHPTQKPISLYAWIYENYAESGQRILDTHLGSGSNAIAAHYAKMGEFVGCELDEDYYLASIERIEKGIAQSDFFIDVQLTEKKKDVTQLRF